jgi:hypothetical protein
MLRFTRESTEEQKRAFFEGLATLPLVIPQIKRYEFGPDLGLGDGNPDAALVADFESEKDWRSYNSHPAHQALVNDLLAPIAGEVIRVQYLVD